MKQAAIVILVLLVVLLPMQVSSKENTGSALSARRDDGGKFRIGYIESSEFVNYPISFYYILKGLEENGLIRSLEGIPFTEGQKVTKTMWDYLSANDVSDVLEFIPDFHYNLEYMDDAQRASVMAKLAVEDIDLVIVLGTVAGSMVAKAEHDVSAMVFSVTDAVSAGIAANYDNSGKDNIWAHTDPERFERQLRVFHDLFKYKKLGYVMENSDSAKAYTPVKEIQKLSAELGFDSVVKYVDMPKNADDYDRYKNDLSKAYRDISDEVDAFYITVAAINADWLQELLTPFYEKKIPVFSQMGGNEVAKGALMSINVSSFKEIGQFGAVRISEILNGQKPGSLNQKYVSTPQIDINLEVAEIINYPVSFDLLLVSDKIYLKIE